MCGPPPNGESTATRYTQVLQSLGPSNQVAILTVNSLLFNFSRISTQDNLLYNKIKTINIISPVRDDMNETVMNCTDLFASTSASAVINIINRDQSWGKYSKLKIKCVPHHHILLLMAVNEK